MIKKAISAALIGVVLAMGAPAFAQGPFADVPVDHWAYDAVSQLQDHGIVIGYPDGTYGGKRALTRYEFAMAISRLVNRLCDLVKPCPGGPAGMSQDEIKKMIDEAMKSGSWATSADVEKMNKLIAEFKDELAGMGVDLDKVKKDLAALDERVTAIEAELKRLKITTKLTFFAIGESMDQAKGQAVDADGRDLANDNNLLENVYFVRDADLIFSFANGDTKAKVVVNAGSYLNYLGQLSDYSGAARSTVADSDSVNLLLAYGEVPLLGATVTAGRFPIQFTKWTLKKYDTDSYTENWKTEDGMHYLDGVKAAWSWGTVDITAFAAKNNSNGGLYQLASRPSGRPYNAAMSALPSRAGLLQVPEQSAGVRAVFNAGAAKIGLNWISIGDRSSTPWESVNVWGADLTIPLKLGADWVWNLAYTQSDTLGAAGFADVDDDNVAWEVAAKAAFGALDFMACYKRIEPNFAAPGDWGLWGRLQNPVNIQGPEVGLKYNANKWSFGITGGWYEGLENTFASTANGSATNFRNYLNADSKIQRYTGGLEFQMSDKDTFGLTGEWVRWDPTGATGNPAETYYTLTYSRKIADNSKIRLLYSLIDYDTDGQTGQNSPYGNNDYSGEIASAQLSLEF